MPHTKKTTHSHISPPILGGIKGGKSGFTLVELIVTITIIAILGAIAFTAFNGFQSGARDSSRATDLTNLSQALDTSYVKIGSYPNPDNAFTVTYSGGSLWYQGTVGDTLINTLSSNGSKMSKKPTDPLNTTKEYSYSKSAYGNTYELSTDWEGDRIVYSHPNNSLIPQAFAASGNPTITYIKGNYNGMVAKTITGSIIYVIATPSITTSTGTVGSNIDVTTLSGKLLYSGQTNSGGIAYTPTLIYTGLTLPTNDDSGQITLLTTNLQTAYSGSVISYNSNISNVLTTTGATNITSLGANIITNYLGGSASAPPPPPATSYSLSNSFLFDSASSQYLSRTPGVAGNPNKWTWSGWVKRGVLGSPQLLFSAATDGSNFEYFRFESTDELFYARYVAGAAQDTLTTVAKYRDPSAWLHVVVNRNGAVRTIYVNGVQVASGGSAAATGEIGQNKAHSIGRRQETASQYFDGYLADVNFVDSGALDPTAFGYTDPTTNQWLPKAYTGTYGTNGFRLDFASGATTTSLGLDSAPIDATHTGANNWTPTGTVVPTPTLNQVIDTPLNNFAVLSPIDTGGHSLSDTISLGSGNLYAAGGTQGTSYGAGTRGTIAVNSGKWYFEFIHNNYAGTGNNSLVGIIRSAIGPNLTIFQSNTSGGSPCIGIVHPYTAGGTVSLSKDVSTYTNMTSTDKTASPGDIIGIAFEINGSSSKMWISKNGQYWNNSEILGAFNENSPTITFTQSNNEYFSPAVHPMSGSASANKAAVKINFGQKTFVFTPPTGFKALSTANLSDPTIKNPKQYFDVLTYVGTSAVQSVGGLSFSPDFLWIKNRTGSANGHKLFDTVRGVDNQLACDATTGENTTAGQMTGFGATGFSLTAGGSANATGQTYVAWNWKKGTTPGFDIQTWNHTSGTPDTISHNLTKTPDMVIWHDRNASGNNWWVQHKDLTGGINGGKNLYLNTTSSGVTNAIFSSINNSTFSFYQGAQTASEIAYLWSEVPGFSKFGSYTGNGSPTDGPFVYTGFRPAYILVKQVDVANGWGVFDSKRYTSNPVINPLQPNTNGTELSGYDFDFTSNGFKLKHLAGYNVSGGTYIYAAFAEAPFKYANAR